MHSLQCSLYQTSPCCPTSAAPRLMAAHSLALVYVWRSGQELIGSLVVNQCFQGVCVVRKLGLPSQQRLLLVSNLSYLGQSKQNYYISQIKLHFKITG